MMKIPFACPDGYWEDSMVAVVRESFALPLFSGLEGLWKRFRVVPC